MSQNSCQQVCAPKGSERIPANHLAQVPPAFGMPAQGNLGNGLLTDAKPGIPLQSGFGAFGTDPTLVALQQSYANQIDLLKRHMDEQLDRHRVEILAAVADVKISMNEQTSQQLNTNQFQSHPWSMAITGNTDTPRRKLLESAKQHAETRKQQRKKSLDDANQVKTQKKTGGGNALRAALTKSNLDDVDDAQETDEIDPFGSFSSFAAYGQGTLRKWFHSPLFDLSVGLLVVANAIMMALYLEYQGYMTAETVGLPKDTSDWPNAGPVFEVFEHVFCITFTVELIVRLRILKWQFFKGWDHWMDLCIVVVSILELYVFPHVNISAANITFLRLIRLAKLVKVLRIVRVMNIFMSLRILAHSIASSFGALCWSMLLLALIELMAAIFMTQTLQPWLRDPDNDLEMRQEVYSFFGTFARSWITMFEITLAPGAWGNIGRKIIYNVNRGYFVFFMLYISCVTFGIVRVITALFLKETLAAATSDHEIVIASRMKQQNKYLADLKKLFEQIDENSDGYITRAELDVLLKNPRSLAWVQVLELEVTEVTALFSLMDDGDGCVSFEEFINGVLRLKGNAKGIDLAMLLHENRKLLQKLNVMANTVENIDHDVGMISGVVIGGPESGDTDVKVDG